MLPGEDSVETNSLNDVLLSRGNLVDEVLENQLLGTTMAIPCVKGIDAFEESVIIDNDGACKTQLSLGYKLAVDEDVDNSRIIEVAIKGPDCLLCGFV